VTDHGLAVVVLQRNISAWLGGSIVATMDGYAEQLITVDEYDEDGPESVHRHNVLRDESGDM